MLNVAICDDDKNFTGTLEHMVKQESNALGISVETNVFFDGDTLVADIKNGSQYDIIFLDIEMKRLDGISAARCIRDIDKVALLIYISRYEQYLKELFEVEPFRFLSKPLDTVLFSRYFEKACEKICEKEAYYRFAFNKELKKVPVCKIAYFKSQNRVINIFLNDSSTEQFYGKLNDVEKELIEGRQHFLRIHQSILVNYNYIKKMNFSSLILLIGNGKEKILNISEDRQKTVRTQLGRIAGGKAVIQ